MEFVQELATRWVINGLLSIPRCILASIGWGGVAAIAGGALLAVILLRKSLGKLGKYSMPMVAAMLLAGLAAVWMVWPKAGASRLSDPHEKPSMASKRRAVDPGWEGMSLAGMPSTGMSGMPSGMNGSGFMPTIPRPPSMTAYHAGGSSFPLQPPVMHHSVTHIHAMPNPVPAAASRAALPAQASNALPGPNAFMSADAGRSVTASPVTPAAVPGDKKPIVGDGIGGADVSGATPAKGVASKSKPQPPLKRPGANGFEGRFVNSADLADAEASNHLGKAHTPPSRARHRAPGGDGGLGGMTGMDGGMSNAGGGSTPLQLRQAQRQQAAMHRMMAQQQMDQAMNHMMQPPAGMHPMGGMAGMNHLGMQGGGMHAGAAHPGAAHPGGAHPPVRMPAHAAAHRR